MEIKDFQVLSRALKMLEFGVKIQVFLNHAYEPHTAAESIRRLSIHLQWSLRVTVTCYLHKQATCSWRLIVLAYYVESSVMNTSK